MHLYRLSAQEYVTCSPTSAVIIHKERNFELRVATIQLVDQLSYDGYSAETSTAVVHLAFMRLEIRTIEQSGGKGTNCATRE